jgi:hypothetical protein
MAETHTVTYVGLAAFASLLAQELENEGVAVSYEPPWEERGTGQDLHDVVVSMVAAGAFTLIEAAVHRVLKWRQGTGNQPHRRGRRRAAPRGRGLTAAMELEKGSPAACAIYRLIEAWDRKTRGQASAEELDDAVAGCIAGGPPALYHAILVVGGAVNTIAMLSGMGFDEVLARLWQQLAARSDDRGAAVMRTVVTAWCNGNAEWVNESGLLDEVEPDALFLHFAAVWVLLARSLEAQHGMAVSASLLDLRSALGADEGDAAGI